MRALYAIVLALCAAACSGGVCYRFGGSSWLKFTRDIDVKNSAYYNMSFQTSQQDGTLFFARGPHSDFESVYIADGALNYFLFNPTPTGHGSSFGIHSRAEGVAVSDGQWHTVEFFRNAVVRGRPQPRTGIIVDGRHEEFEDEPRENVDIRQPFYVGGTPSSHTTGFTGTIRSLEEKRSGFKFTSHYTNEEVTILPQC